MRKVAIALLGVLFAFPAQADLWDDCGNRENPIGMLQACTTLINDPSTPQNRLSEAYLYRCQAKDIQGSPGEALPDCLAARGLDPEDSSIYNSLTIIFLQLNNPSEAVQAAEAGLKLKPEDGNYWNGRANARCAAGQFEGAYQDRLKALELGRFTAEGLQRAVANRGYYKGAIDGKFGEASKNALWQWTQAGCP
ncbi:MAG: hypothetical protein AAF557_01230 [Pseudomonadota bacterium]